ncbi:hypothetical protein [Luteibacter aegosomatissinici]|uniref:hypothetical protein n=1 Tax=Luteibacter aegosomatissinici TaxID=2911539 RepID=UPI001FF750BA|nr:hypothetical protein [Luteibacter aegosomatissinici]UPG93765.1 hypothetical protein L2Y97_18280 [Luteibacter aegosomatissinici]
MVVPFQSIEDEVLASLQDYLESGRLAVMGKADPVFEALGAAFPVPINRIAFWDIPGHMKGGGDRGPDVQQAFAAFVRGIVQRDGLGGEIVAIGDNFVNVAIRGNIEDVLEAMPMIAAFPQHTYLCPFPNPSWCASLTFEGDFYFAYAPTEIRTVP